MGRTSRQRSRQQRPSAGQIEEKKTLKYLIRSFHQEMKSNGWDNSTKLCIRMFPDIGRGICSKTESFQKNDKLIELPIRSMITIKTLEEDEIFINLFDSTKPNNDNVINFQSLLAIYVLYQKHLEENSKFHFYTEMLPSGFNTPLFMTISELFFLPEPLLLDIVEVNRKIKEQHSLVLSLLRSELCPCCEQSFQEEIFSLANFKWSYHVVNTRSVYLDSKQFMPEIPFFKKFLRDSTNTALAPFLDLFNHSNDVETKAELIFNKNSSQWDYTISLIKGPDPIPARSQIFINYGSFPNKKLLLEYGFFIPSNSHDYFEVTLLDIENFLKEEKSFAHLNVDRRKFKFIRDHNLCDAMFLHPTDGISHNLHIVFHLIFREESHFPNVLNRIAFGNANDLEDITLEISLFIYYQLKQYLTFKEKLLRQETLSPPAQVFKGYILETMSLLQECVKLLKKPTQPKNDEFMDCDDDMGENNPGDSWNQNRIEQVY